MLNFDWLRWVPMSAAKAVWCIKSSGRKPSDSRGLGLESMGKMSGRRGATLGRSSAANEVVCFH